MLTIADSSQLIGRSKKTWGLGGWKKEFVTRMNTDTNKLEISQKSVNPGAIMIKMYFGVEICQLPYYIGNKGSLNGN